MLKLIRAACGSGRDCPNINTDESGSLIVVGYPTTTPSEIRVPAHLAPEWDAPHRRSGADLLLSGQPVTDPAVLSVLEMDSHEAAIVVRATELPALDEEAVR